MSLHISVIMLFFFGADLYAGTVQGFKLLSGGAAFSNAIITSDNGQSFGPGPAPYAVALSSGAHTILSSIPPGFAVSYSVCINCYSHPASSYVSGNIVALNVPTNGSIDLWWMYTPNGSSTITIASPVENQVLSGNVTFSLSGSGLSKAASVEYLIGAYRISRIQAQLSNPNFQIAWNSGLAADGTSQIEIIARDFEDKVLFHDFQSVIINNYGNFATSTLPSQVSGTLPVTLSAFDSRHFPAYWQLFVDGELPASPSGLLFSDQDGTRQNFKSTNLDTTAYPNGRHEFHFAFHSNDYPATSDPSAELGFRGMVTQNFNIDNGRTFMEVMANYLYVYVPVSTGVQLTCSRVYTNLDRDPCTNPQFSIRQSNSSPEAQVTPGGFVNSSREGFADIILFEDGKTTDIYVWFRNDPGLPHFIDNGKMSTEYVPGKSIFAVSPFQLAPSDVRNDQNLYQEAKKGGVNTLNRGFYLVETNISTPFANWKQNYDSIGIFQDWQWSAANGFRVLGTGDDIARRPGYEGFWTMNWPGAQQAVQYAMQQFAQSGAALSVDVVDEASALWGTNPTPVGIVGGPHALQSVTCTGLNCVVNWPSLSDPNDYLYHDTIGENGTFALTGNPALNTPAGSAYAVKGLHGSSFGFSLATPMAGPQAFDAGSSPQLEYLWFAKKDTCWTGFAPAPCTPPLPNSTLQTIAGWLRAAPSAVAISWPPSGIALPYVHHNWMKPGGISDYSSHYWDSNQQRRTYKFGMGIRETQNSMLTALYSRQALIQINRPQLVEQSISGIDYLKFSPPGTSIYNPPVDVLRYVGATPKSVVSGIMTAAAFGAAGVRLYKYDNDYQGRSSNPGNGTEFSTGAGPVNGEVKNWQAMAYASSLLSRTLQPYILGSPMSSPALGRNIVTGARKAQNGNLLMVVNGWDGSRTVIIDLTPHKNGLGSVRYRVGDTYTRITPMADANSDTIEMNSGETAIYLFPNQNTSLLLDSVAFTPDTPGAKVILRTNYLYPGNVATYGDPVDCSKGCSVQVDRNIGPVYYYYAILDGAGTLQCQSPALTLPSQNSISLPTGTQTRGATCN